MVVKPGQLVLQIPPQINNFRVFIEECFLFVSEHSSLAKDFKRSAKFKLAIMELLTNAMKHCRETTYLELQCSPKKVVVKKIDCGQRFTFKDVKTNQQYHFPISHFSSPTQINALLGNNYTLLVNIKGENQIEFLEPPAIDYLMVDDIPENFGLMIIKQCCDSFHYYYNQALSQNIFEVVFNF